MEWVFLSVLAICICVVVKTHIETRPPQVDHLATKRELRLLERKQEASESHVRSLDNAILEIVYTNPQIRNGLSEENPFRKTALHMSSLKRSSEEERPC